jgi:hypothetical protein
MFHIYIDKKLGTDHTTSLKLSFYYLNEDASEEEKKTINKIVHTSEVNKKYL